MSVCEAATEILHASDTVGLDFKVEDKVCCAVGELKGMKGMVAAYRAGGRILVRLTDGLYVELPRFCVRKDEA